jgi:hypothetical protein
VCFGLNQAAEINGKVWDPANGFYTKDFSFTSGIINTGTSFRQKYGIFTAKIKLTDPNVRNAFWLIGDRITPHVNVCRSGHGKVWFDLFSAPGSHYKKLGSKYLSEFYIYSPMDSKRNDLENKRMEVLRQTTAFRKSRCKSTLEEVDKTIG